MKTPLFLFLLVGCAWLPFGVRAQTDIAPAPALDPAKVAEYQKRFEDGYALEKQGQLAQARVIYDGILAEQPQAKRSLLEAGRVSLELGDFQKADDYLEKLHVIVPDFPEAYELLIQANQGLKRDVKVERLVREFRALRDSGRSPDLENQLYFNREHIPLDQGAEIVFTQFFDYTKAPFYALRAESFGPGHTSQRVLLLKYDPDGTAQLHAKDPAASKSEVFILAEPFMTDGKMTRIDVYQELFATPDYEKARNIMLGIFAHTPKAVYSAPVDASAP